MTVLKLGSRGDAVRGWQAFLNDVGLLADPPDGTFGEDTRRATMQFQSAHGLEVDGKVGPNTLKVAEKAGYLSARSLVVDRRGAFVPPEPDFQPVTTTAGREALFGRFEYVAAPTADNPEAIRILDDWAKRNLVQVDVPQLAGVPYGWGGACTGKVRFHRLGAEPLKAMFRDWEAERLLALILTFDGAYAPRLQRGSATALSSHAFGSALDLNAEWNGLNRPPAQLGAQGSVVELVEIANRHGFYWGGHFSKRADGMHFELARLP